MSMRGDAQIAARGFQPYDGPRSGVAGAIRSVSIESIRATLGLGRPARTKIFPVVSVAIAYVPAIVFVGVSVLIPGDLLDPNEVADYAGYYGFITLAIILFSALVAPEVLVSDRRNGMLAMYLSTPLHRGTYLTSKVIAVARDARPGDARSRRSSCSSGTRSTARAPTASGNWMVDVVPDLRVGHRRVGRAHRRSRWRRRASPTGGRSPRSASC